MDQSQFTKFQTLVYKLTGVAIANTRQSMLASRVGSRMRALNMTDFDAYYKTVNTDESERERFIDKVTTHETSFFRTPGIWQYLETTLLPSLSNSGQSLNAWSAAASSGEESYSLSMLASNYRESSPGFQFAISASDISSDIIERCKSASYQGRNIERFREAKPEYFDRHMQPCDTGFAVKPAIANRVKFFTHNLLEAPARKKQYNLVLLRNVLIYFTPEDQARVVTNVRQAMTDDGILIIGESETIPHTSLGFSDVEPFIYQVDSAFDLATQTANG